MSGSVSGVHEKALDLVGGREEDERDTEPEWDECEEEADRELNPARTPSLGDEPRPEPEVVEGSLPVHEDDEVSQNAAKGLVQGELVRAIVDHLFGLRDVVDQRPRGDQEVPVDHVEDGVRQNGRNYANPLRCRTLGQRTSNGRREGSQDEAWEETKREE